MKPRWVKKTTDPHPDPHPHSHPQPQPQAQLQPHQNRPKASKVETPKHFQQDKHKSTKVEQSAEPDPSNPKPTKADRKWRDVEKRKVSNMKKRNPTTTIAQQSQQAKDIISRLASNEYECMICMGVIGRRGKIWTCKCCYIILHNDCINKWYGTRAKAEEGSGWACPGCLYEFVEPPGEYKCFCGKTTDPKFNPYLTPHACDLPCGRKREGNCPHPCTLACHPGFCPPCPALGELKRCPCNSTQYQIRCGEVEKKARCCDNPCNKRLTCQKHFCTKTCHEGACDPCEVTEEQFCFCGKVREQRGCGSGTKVTVGDKQEHRFSCQAVCDRLLACNRHRCNRVCHLGACAPCSRAPGYPQRCACGKHQSYEWFRSNCEQPFPLCNDICGALLSCGMHECSQKCHDSPCPPCKETITELCRCQSSKVTFPCNEYVALSKQARGDPEALKQLILCKKVCKLPLPCGQHKCNRVCCAATVQGGVDGMLAHRCGRVCNKPLSCGRHNCDNFCHLGNCEPCRAWIREGLSCACGKTRLDGAVICGTHLPPCPEPCSRQRACGHPCRLLCHEGACPPCLETSTRKCAGGHVELNNIPCNLTNPSCGRPCATALTCGEHICKKNCHAGPCEENKSRGQPCNQKCGKLRKCSHPCLAQCHSGSVCPDLPCREDVVITCDCKRQTKTVRCLQAKDTPPIACDEECERQERNARLREALGIDAARGPVIPYPAVLLDKIIDEDLLAFTAKTEKTLEDFVRANDGRMTKTLASMNGKQRWLVHQLAPHYNLTSESFDREPYRSVRLTKSSRSVIPKMSFTAALQQYQASPNARTVGSRNVLEFYDLHKANILPQHLKQYLKPWENQYKLNWLDKTYAVAVFLDFTLIPQVKRHLAGKFDFGDEEYDPEAIDRRREEQRAYSDEQSQAEGEGEGDAHDSDRDRERDRDRDRDKERDRDRVSPPDKPPVSDAWGPLPEKGEAEEKRSNSTAPTSSSKDSKAGSSSSGSSSSKPTKYVPPHLRGAEALNAVREGKREEREQRERAEQEKRRAAREERIRKQQKAPTTAHHVVMTNRFDGLDEDQ